MSNIIVNNNSVSVLSLPELLDPFLLINTDYINNNFTPSIFNIINNHINPPFTNSLIWPSIYSNNIYNTSNIVNNYINTPFTNSLIWPSVLNNNTSNVIVDTKKKKTKKEKKIIKIII